MAIITEVLASARTHGKPPSTVAIEYNDVTLELLKIVVTPAGYPIHCRFKHRITTTKNIETTKVRTDAAETFTFRPNEHKVVFGISPKPAISIENFDLGVEWIDV